MNLKILVHLLMFSLTFYGVIPSQEKNTGKTELPLSEKQAHLYIDNYRGEITVEVHQVNSITIYSEIFRDPQKEFTGDSTEVSLGTLEYDDGWLVYADTPCTQVQPDERKVKYCCCEEEDLKDKFNLKVLVPEQMNIRISGINGNIDINGINGKAEISQVNGNILLTNMSGLIDAETVNGDIETSFNNQVAEQSSFETLNGDISITCPEKLSANIRFKAFNGNLYTDFGNVSEGTELVENSKKTENGKTIFDYRVCRTIDVGGGENIINFETFNGNVYLRKK